MQSSTKPITAIDIPVLQALREATYAVHERLHIHPLTAPLTALDLTQAHYINVLQAFYGFYRPCESQIAGVDQMTSRVTWLEQDLEYFGCNTADISLCFEIPPLQHTAQQLGYFYVVEGSSLGSQIIAQHLHASLGVTPDTGGRFFHAYGKQTGKRWRDYKTQLETKSTQLYQGIVDSACHTFAVLERWLTYCYQRWTWQHNT